MSLPKLKKKKRTQEEIKAFFKSLFKEEVPEIRVLEYGAYYVICVEQSYEYVKYAADELFQICEFFGTWDVSPEHETPSRGCDTCDYGSSYQVEFKVTK